MNNKTIVIEQQKNDRYSNKNRQILEKTDRYSYKNRQILKKKNRQILEQKQTETRTKTDRYSNKNKQSETNQKHGQRKQYQFIMYCTVKT